MTSANRDPLAAFWLPFTPNRSFKEQPRLFTGAEGLHYVTADGRIAVKSYTGMIADDGAVFSPAKGDKNGQMQPLTTVGRANFQ